MGAWGTGPLANDTALDWLEPFTHDLEEGEDPGEDAIAYEDDRRAFLTTQAVDLMSNFDVEGSIWFREYAVLRAVAEKILLDAEQYQLHFSPELLTRLSRTIAKIADDSDWMDSWNEPEEVAEDLWRQADALHLLANYPLLKPDPRRVSF